MGASTLGVSPDSSLACMLELAKFILPLFQLATKHLRKCWMPKVYQWMVQELCNDAATRPQSLVVELQLITSVEVTQVLRTFNAWDLPYTELLNPEHQTIHGMFEHWAKHTPDAPSLTFGVCDSVPTFIRAGHISHAGAYPYSAAEFHPSLICLGFW